MQNISFEYIEDLQDELQWDVSFKETQQQLSAAAQRAQREIAEGKALPLDQSSREARSGSLASFND